jgi:hypothetical protein
VGTSTISVTAGNVTGSTVLTVPSLASLTLTPGSPSISVGALQQVTASGTFTDGTVRDQTAVAVWSSSNNLIASVGNSNDTQGVIIGVGPGTATVGATVGSVSGTTSVTVTPAATPPNIATVTPTSGTIGTPVTITGSGFGDARGSGIVWLGSIYGNVSTWSNTQIVATVAAGSTSGMVQVKQGGSWSNAIPFNVDAPIILSVSPTSGLPGTTVTITGSGFGSVSGSVWLGTANGVVLGWDDAHVVAQVAPDSTSGVAQILRNGVLSNAVGFAVNLPHISNVTPTAGSQGAVVTITGTGFGATQGTGSLRLGTLPAIISNWRDTEIIALVAASSQNGIVQVAQNGFLSNVRNFSVPPSGTSTNIHVTPDMMTMVVGEARTLQALDANGAEVHGLTWAVTNTAAASLSTDDPPVLTAIAPGHITITAGDGSADLTISPDPVLSVGTIIWSAPGDGSGVTSIVPAVPSSEGVADVFAFQGSGSVQAITSDGRVAWTAGASPGAIPDFQGGLIANDAGSITKLDGMTGIAYPSYYTDGGHPITSVSVHTSGTVFAVTGDSVVAIDPKTAVQKGNFSMEHSRATVNGVSTDSPPTVGKLIVAGDGYAYVPYWYSQDDWNGNGSSSSSHTNLYLNVVRVGSGGDALKIPIKHWTGDSASFESPGSSVPQGYAYCDGACMQFYYSVYPNGQYNAYSGAMVCWWTFDPYGQRPCFNDWHAKAFYCDSVTGCTTTNYDSVSNYVYAPRVADLITNSDQGAVLSFTDGEGGQSSIHVIHCILPCENSSTTYETPGTVKSYLATILSGGGVGLAELNVPEPNYPAQPVLQAQDNSFFGTLSTDSGNFMVGFGASGNLTFAKSGNYQPKIATADGGVIAKSDSGTTLAFDQNGDATGQLGSLPTYSWKGAYRLGSIVSFKALNNAAENSYAAVLGGNYGSSPTATRLPKIGLYWCGTAHGDGSCADIHGLDVQWKYIPNVTSDNFDKAQDFSATHPEWVDAIEGAALDALQKAFKQFPVTVERALSHKGTAWECVTNGHLPGCTLPDEADRVYVSGVWPGDGATGLTTGVVPLSFAYYWISLQNSQGALKLNPLFPPQTDGDRQAFVRLLKSIGIGVGNAAAHELGHHFQYTFRMNMDCPSRVACLSDDRHIFELDGATDWEYLHVYPEIDWQKPDNVCAIHQYFEDNYRDKNCTGSYKK